MMVKFGLLVALTMVLSFVGAQPQKVTGASSAQPKKSITFLPGTTIGPNGKETTTTEETKPTKGFVFNKPIVQSAASNGPSTSNNKPATSSNNLSPFSGNLRSGTYTSTAGTSYHKPTVQLSSTPGKILPELPQNATNTASSTPLKYEEPPAKLAPSTNSNNIPGKNITSNNESIYGLSYGAPPVVSKGLRSPKIMGLYKAEPHKPILIVPIAPEAGQPAAAQEYEPQPQGQTTPQTMDQTPKFGLAEQEPPTSKGTATAQVGSNLVSPKVEGAYVAENKKPILLVPIAASENNVANNNVTTVTIKTNNIQDDFNQQFPSNEGNSKPSSGNKKSANLQDDFNQQFPSNEGNSKPSSGNKKSANLEDDFNSQLTRKDQLTSDFDNQSTFAENMLGTTKSSKRRAVRSAKNALPNDKKNESITVKENPKYRFAMPVKQSDDGYNANVPAQQNTQLLKDFDATENGTMEKENRGPQQMAEKPIAVVEKRKEVPQKFNPPVKQTMVNTPIPARPVEEKNIVDRPNTNYTKPVRQSDNNNNNSATISGRTEYKFYVSPNGKYTVVFNAAGSSVTVTSFGRVNDFALPSNGGNAKPGYNYKGLIDAVGSLPLQYNYEGRVAFVGAAPLSYNYNGAIEKVGEIPITYNHDGTVDKIGNSKISYDYQGNITSMDKNALVLLKQ